MTPFLEIEEKARSSGCDHYVTKPYSPMQLLRVIRGFLGDKEPSEFGGSGKTIAE